jgi:signal peptidase II
VPRTIGTPRINAARSVTAAAIGSVTLLNLTVEHLLLVRRPPDAVLIPGLLDFHHAWNRGVSFSLLWQDTDRGSLLLSLFLAAIVIVLGAMAWRAKDALSALGLGLIIGGALGNLYDRVAYRAVFDFLFLHLGRMPLFVCNIADIPITLGVLCLVGEAFKLQKP